MIKSLSLSNFQSHKDTILEFVPGINTIVGSSDSGKSAILRAIYWVAWNRPSGDSLVSHWALDSKGKQIDITQVMMHINGQEIHREKYKVNQYGIGNKKNGSCSQLDAVGKEVPDEISNILNLSEVNIQKQLEAPFLLSDSAGEVARFFNRIIHLEDIDKVLASADSLKRSTKSEIIALESQIRVSNLTINSLDWLKEANSCIEKLIKLEVRSKEIILQCEGLEKTLNLALSISENLAKFPDLTETENSINNLIRNKKELDAYTASIGKMTKTITDYTTGKDYLDKFPDYSSISISISAIEEQIKQLNTVNTQINNMQSTITQLKSVKNHIKDDNDELSNLLRQMPDVCPLCNNPIKGGNK